MCYTNQFDVTDIKFVRDASTGHLDRSTRFPPDGILTSGHTKYDVKLDPHIIAPAPDPFASVDCLDDYSPVHQLLSNTTEELSMMNPGADEPSFGLNGRLRPRKSNVSSPQTTKTLRKSDGRTSQDKVKQTNTPVKTSPNKLDDLTAKSDTTFLCPYCDGKFASKQTLSKHVRRMHDSSSKQDSFIACLFCNQYEAEANNIVRHMAESHPQQYFACLTCHTRYPSPSDVEEHKIKACNLKLPYRSKLRQKASSVSSKVTQKVKNFDGKDDYGKESNVFTDGHSFNGIVISCELKPSQVSDGADIEDNITTNLILPPSKSLGSNTVVEKNAVIVLDDIHWNKRIPPNFSFHNTDADQILSRLGVVHRSPRTGESSKKDWKTVDDSTQKFEKCFDTSFYSKVASNVQENLSKFLDGSFNFNPDPDSTIKTRKSKNSVPINTAEGFPILLASEQYSRNAFDRYMPRAIAPKHKWKWDNLESEKSPINPDQIKRDSHTNSCIISLVSGLDIWTQLRMRRKFEEKFGCAPLEKKTEKQTIINNELKDILESRELPTSTPQIVKMTNKPRASTAAAEFPWSLGLGPSTSREEPQSAVLSGEWVRPRCYVCCACGAQNRDARAASTHAATQHPNAQVQHYEIVGEQLLNADILKHLYVPPSQMCNRTRPLRGFRECTKCSKSITLEDLHQHMLDCAGDTPTVRRKCRYRPFGVRRRRPRLPDNTIRKKIRKHIRTRQTRPKSLLRPRPIRTEVGDAETIRKMIADLPAKRHRVPMNPNNPSIRPRIKQRSNLLIKGRTEDHNKRKKNNNQEINITLQPGSPMYDGTSVKSDEDKPLKPKVKRMASKKSTQRVLTNSDKRKTASLNRPKRKHPQVKELEKYDHNKDSNKLKSSFKRVITENLSIENSSKKIDFQSIEFNGKEYASGGNSNNHDGQQPGCSGQNGHSQNHCAPAQNIPLKHSIARLTADSEKHDKSVQFHHLFLVQQECNNVNQHVQSGQQLLFENEAAVLTLDKPPLHCNTIAPLDAYSLQKNRLNKPRKGLNACIAMLKNKLVEPSTNIEIIPTGHVSVQCGDDEPLYLKPDTALGPQFGLERNEEMIPQSEVSENSIKKKVALVATSQCAANPEKNIPYTDSDADNTHHRPSTRSGHVITLEQKPQNTETKRQSSRRRSLVNKTKVISQIDLIPQKDATELISALKPIPSKSIQIAVNASGLKAMKKQNIEGSKTKCQTQETVAAKHREPVKLDEGQQAILHLPKKSKLYDLSFQSTETVNDTTDQAPSDNYYGNSLNPQQQASNFPIDCDYNRKISTEHFLDTDFNHMTVNIRPAHASTNVESIVSIPLDLSGRLCDINNSQDLSNHENAYLLRNSYETYETLDLSNKNQDLSCRADANLTIHNEIVDLSIKTPHSKLKEVEVTEKNDDVTDLSLNSVVIDLPTDLTVKKKEPKSSIVLIDKTINTEAVILSYNENTSNRDKQVKRQFETGFSPPTGDFIKEAKSNSVSSILGQDNVNASDKVLKNKPVDLSQEPKPKNSTMLSTVNVSEKLVENVSIILTNQSKTSNTPIDLLKNLPSTIPQTSETVSTKTHDPTQDMELNSEPMDPHQGDKYAIQVQKPIYDPTLKIPQYKIRAATTVDAPVKTDLLTYTSSSIVQAKTSSNFTHVPNYTVVTAMAPVDAITSVGKSSIGIQDRAISYGSLPNSNTGSVFGITNYDITAHLSKFKSTTPIYTLANACISVTKIESTNSLTLTNTLLTPGTTIANTTPVYTLTGTTISVPAQYPHIVPASPSNIRGVDDFTDRCSIFDKNEEFSFGSTSSKNTDYNKESNTSQELTNTTNLMFSADQDPETARKIALLPKELVEILGNMPIDHRNQLLNVLPQYVSTPTSVSTLQCDLTNDFVSAEKNSSQSLEQNESNLPNLVESMEELEPQNGSPLANIQGDNDETHGKKSGTVLNFDRKSPVPALTYHTTSTKHTPTILSETSKTEESMQQVQITKEEPRIELIKIKSDIISHDSCTTLYSSRKPSCHKKSTNKVIDLTEDEIVSRTEIQNGSPLDVSPQLSLLVQPKRNKVNNDQTASLRAVRIKAPSERQRSVDSQLLKQTNLTPLISNKINCERDNEVKKSLHINVSLNTDISLAIQQAEVSSTQHSNKNVVSECKFASAISPNAQELNVDEINNCTSRRTSSASKDETINISDIQNVQSKSVAKSTLVTSSILNNIINKECTKGNDQNCSSLSSEFSSTKYLSRNVISSESDDFNKKEPNLVTDSSIHVPLDIAKPYNIPNHCSSPDSKPLLDKQKEQVASSKNHSCLNICVDQEDSDDDLSLAVICKKKQQNLKKEPVNNESAPKMQSNTRRKKVKKSKKCLENVTGQDLISEEETLCNNNTLLPVALEQKCHQKDNTDANDGALNCAEDDMRSMGIDRSIKKKDRRNKVEMDVIDNTNDKVSNIALIECDIKKNVVKTGKSDDKDTQANTVTNEIADINYNTAFRDDTKYSMDTTRKRSIGSDDKEIDIINTNIQHTFEENVKMLKHVEAPLRQKNKIKSTQSDKLPSKLEHEEQKKCNMSDLLKNRELKSVLVTETEIDIKEVNLNQTSNLKDSCLARNSEKLSSDSIHLEGTTTIHDTTVSDVLPTPRSESADTEFKLTALRRSRRRKSLSNSVDDEESLQHTEVLQENRTPLTKKQLIFSKLLLDEENNTKHPKEVLDTGCKKTEELEIIQTKSVAVENMVIDKSKPVKRKKSPHLKRKWKKRKSLSANNGADATSELLSSQTKHVDVTPKVEGKNSKSSESTLSHFEHHASLALESTQLTADTVSSLHKDKSLITALEKRKNDDTHTEDSQPKKSKLKRESSSDVETSYISLSNIEKDIAHLEPDDVIKKPVINVTRDPSGYNIACEESKQLNIPSDRTDKNELDVSNTSEEKGSKVNVSVKTCYNMPVAGRRTRSKSAVIKSVVYDPYDIDMDDMIEPSEPLRQHKISSDHRLRLSNNTKHLASSKQIEYLTTVEEEKGTSLNDELHTHKMRNTMMNNSFAKNDISDSDDSSKSDIPLKKYVEEKEKKISKFDEGVSMVSIDAQNDVETHVTSIENQNSLKENRTRRTLGVNHNSDGAAQDETEEQLRSEQFMESFGFFSERKPRKSNLLATKKISETFHIIANECDDMYFGFKERSPKKTMQNENRKSIEGERNVTATRHRSPPPKKTVKRGRKKKTSTVTALSYCHICKKEFRRSDNYLRHQMTLLHVSKLSEVEMKVKTIPIQEEPNYLLAYKEHLDRIKIITDKMTKSKKKSKSGPKITPLTLEEILADVNKILREQQLAQRGLSCDEELFLDCCELLKESHKKQEHVADMPSMAQDTENILYPSQSTNMGLDLLGKCGDDIKFDSKNDGDVDSITAKTILESEEVRNLENDLISGLKEAANASNHKTNTVFQQTINDEDADQQREFIDDFSSPAVREMRHDEPLNNYEEREELNKTKKYPEFKEKMYPDIEEIDMFEDKFDKIKRKCRSQAAAAKQTQLIVEPSTSRKGRKKSEKKKGKKYSKKNHPSAVLTKGALKGFDGVKPSVSTSDMNISATVSPLGITHKKKKKGSSKKRRENKNSESSSKYDSDHPIIERSASKNVDVYEFMDNEDVELFEFRPSTLMERFKSISNKESPSTSKVTNPIVEDAENSIASASDGDDFVYMSDDYVCSDDETENSLMSCDVSNTKVISDCKKHASQMKRRDVLEKNAVMGKIFKNNAVRSEKKITKSKEPVKPKANLDQLFDSLLEDEPSSSMLNDESLPLKDDITYTRQIENSSPIQSDSLSSKYEQYIKKTDQSSAGKENYASVKQKILSPENDDEISSKTYNGPTLSKITMKSLMGEHKRIKYRKHHSISPQKYESVSLNKYDTASSKHLHSQSKKNDKGAFLHDDFSDYHKGTSQNDAALKNNECKSYEDRSPVRKIDDEIGISCDYNEFCDQSFTSDETGVARQRARRKCTVGKQNVLAETWSSESEPDGGPPRPNSAESMVSATLRKRKGKKKEGQHTSGRRGNTRHISFKKQDIESRVSSIKRNTTIHTSAASTSCVVENRSAGRSDGTFGVEMSQPSTSTAVAGTSSAVFEPPAAPSTSSGGSAEAPKPSTSAGVGASSSAGGPALDPSATLLAPDDPDDPDDPNGTEAVAEEEEGQEGDEGSRFESFFIWTAEGNTPHAQQLRQQHGWIVGNSHKKLVTMLAQAKRRKRNNDDKSHLV